MKKFIMKVMTISQVCQLYFERVRAESSSEQAQRIINEFRSALFRYLLPIWGFEVAPGRKMTLATVQQAEEYTKTLSVQRLLRARAVLKEAFESSTATRASQNTYGNRIEQFLCWAEEQPWWPSPGKLKIQNQCCPPRRLSGRRHYSDLPLTSRQGQYLRYRLTEQETPLALQKQLDDLEHFLVAPAFPGRVLGPIRQSTADTYIKDIRLILGYFHRHQGIPIAELNLQHPLPLVTEDELEGLTHRQQQRLWREKQLYLETWIFQYFEFIRKENNSTSPRTQLGKLIALQRLGHYLYRQEVSRKNDYRMMPVFATLDELISKVVKTIKKWQKTRTYVSNQEHKWPDVVEGETALSTLRREIVEPLRLECRPRRKTGTFREPDVIAISLQHYLKWAVITDLPPRRQSAYRTTRVALSCPIERTKDVPADGCYFPLLPLEERQKNHDGTLADNYLYKSYTYKGKSYEEGIWILELCSYKTDETYGIYSMMVPDRQFEDMTSFYDHLEHYLCGWWMSEGYKNRQVYDWWDLQLRGQRGRWVTKGRMEFEPKDICESPSRHQSAIWRWGYLFPVSRTGEPASGCSFGGSFERTSYQILGKRVTPHMVRSVWATWAFQVSLTDRERGSLAYAMGHSVETLRQIYERCTPEEKLRPIFEVIDRLLFQQLEEPPEEGTSQPNRLKLVEDLRKLTPEERQQIFKLAEGA